MKVTVKNGGLATNYHVLMKKADTSELTSFTVDLGDMYSVSRIRSVVAPSNLGLGNNRERIIKLVTLNTKIHIGEMRIRIFGYTSL